MESIVYEIFQFSTQIKGNRITFLYIKINLLDCSKAMQGKKLSSGKVRLSANLILNAIQMFKLIEIHLS